VRDTRESRLLLVLLVAISFALITVDIRGGEQSPLGGARSAAAAVFGPVENGVAGAVDPVGNAMAAVRDSHGRANRISGLERENAQLKQELASKDAAGGRVKELDKLLGTAAAGQYTVKAAQVVAIGAAQGFSWTVTIDVGRQDGIKRDMTVINGDGLVGRVTTVGPSASTVLLACDPDFTVGTRMEKSSELGFATGQGNRPMRVELLNGKADVKPGQRLVTFGSQADRPFVPGVPVGTVVSVDPSGGALTKTVQVKPFVRFTGLDIVGVVVQSPRTDPRDAVLPHKPKPAPTVTVTATPKPGKSASGAPAQPGASETASTRPGTTRGN
jgi:rod shape-determining protein MreC